MASGNYVNLYSSKAHVFTIPHITITDTKINWIPKGDQAIPISFVTSIIGHEVSANELSKRELKIIGTGTNGETVLDATILPKTTFTKRSQKFGQWSDHTGAVYGLGFNSEAELLEFVDTFQRLQRDILAPPSNNPHQPQHHGVVSSGNLQSQMAPQRQGWNQQQQNLNNNVSETNGRYNQTGKGSSSSINNTQQYSNTLSHPGHQQVKRQQQQELNNNQSNGDISLNNNGSGDNNLAGYPRSQSMFGIQSRTNNNSANNDNNNSLTAGASPEAENSPVSQTEWQIREQLKYENERLKQALEQSAKNAGIWNNELLNLRTNNVKLTQALQESKAHVEEWERELLSLRDENKELKLRVLALESADDPEKAAEYKKDLQKYKNYVDECQSELRRKENEIEELQRSMEELEVKAQASSQNGETDGNPPVGSQNLQMIDIINAKLSAKLKELVGIQKEFSQIVEKLHH